MKRAGLRKYWNRGVGYARCVVDKTGFDDARDVDTMETMRGSRICQ